MYETRYLHRPLAALCGVLLATSATGAAEEMRVTDNEIENALESKLIYDPAVNANTLDVDVNAGVVELTGTVSVLMTKDRAELIAKRLKGVRAVSNRLEVEAAVERSDKNIRNDVIMALIEDPVTESYQIRVTVDDGTVTLTGEVESWQEKQFATRVTKGVKGVEAVTNDVAVTYAQDRPDKEIQAEVEKRLKWNVLLDGYLIEVAVDNAVVTLSGTVGSLAEYDTAYRLAWVAGVDEVDAGQLSVHDWAKDDMVREEALPDVKDSELEEAIKDAMLYDPRVLSFEIDVEVAHGYATLTGTVDNLKAKLAAEDLADNVIGVYTVNNYIKVLGADVYDYEIEADVEAALLANPYTESYEIGVRAKDGVVTLTGTVDTFLEKAEAADEVASVTGVSRVVNKLQVYADAGYYRYDPYMYPWSPLIENPDIYVPLATPVTDSAIKDEIESELFWSPFVDQDQVTVTVDDGIATLTGTVDSWREFDAATNNAYQGGAIVVHNELIVE